MTRHPLQGHKTGLARRLAEIITAEPGLTLDELTARVAPTMAPGLTSPKRRVLLALTSGQSSALRWVRCDNGRYSMSTFRDIVGSHSEGRQPAERQPLELPPAVLVYRAERALARVRQSPVIAQARQCLAEMEARHPLSKAGRKRRPPPNVRRGRDE